MAVKSIYTNIVEKFTTLTAAFVLINDIYVKLGTKEREKKVLSL